MILNLIKLAKTEKTLHIHFKISIPIHTDINNEKVTKLLESR